LPRSPLGRVVAAGESDGTDNLTLLSNTPKPAPFETEGDFNSDLAFDNTENCVAHNGNLIPNSKGRDVLIQSWYQGGTSVIDWTDPRNVREIGGFDRGPIDETGWSSAAVVDVLLQRPHLRSEIQRGFDVFKLDDPAVAGGDNYRYRTLTEQTQERF
jgi:hypothetical protein